MSVKIYKPTTPGQRGMTGSTFEEITKTKPERSLLVSKSQKAGRNVYGRITVRHQGGGSKQRVRIVDFKRGKNRHSCQSFLLLNTIPSAQRAWLC